MAAPSISLTIAKGIHLGWRLFLRDRRAVGLIDDSYEGAVRSFWCAAAVLPVLSLQWWLKTGYEGEAPGNFGVLAAQAGLPLMLLTLAMFTAIGWASWLLIMHWVAPFLDRDRFYFRYVTAFNWSQFFVSMVMLAPTTLRYLDVMPRDYDRGVTIAFMAILWIYHYFILRLTMEVNAGYAILLTAGQFLLAKMFTSLAVAVMY